MGRAFPERALVVVSGSPLSICRQALGGDAFNDSRWQHYPTRQAAHNDIVDYIAMFYNPLRLHSYLDYKSPDQ